MSQLVKNEEIKSYDLHPIFPNLFLGLSLRISPEFCLNVQVEKFMFFNKFHEEIKLKIDGICGIRSRKFL